MIKYFIENSKGEWLRDPETFGPVTSCWTRDPEKAWQFDLSDLSDIKQPKTLEEVAAIYTMKGPGEEVLSFLQEEDLCPGCTLTEHEFIDYLVAVDPDTGNPIKPVPVTMVKGSNYQLILPR